MDKAMTNEIEQIIAAADWKCVVCDTPKSIGCGCWSDCACGWKFRAAGECQNPVHGGLDDEIPEDVFYTRG